MKHLRRVRLLAWFCSLWLGGITVYWNSWSWKFIATSTILHLLVTLSPHVPDYSISDCVALTRREKEVLAGVARGERRKEIAARLGITERTVRAYLTSIYTKLNVKSRAAAVAAAIEHGLLSLNRQHKDNDR